ncbi:MAG: helix-turn-helix domain-containing protein [Blastocatellia bacterium]
MIKPRKQGLSHYVDRIMREKHLSRRDVKLRSGGEITDSYVSGIISGNARNLSIEKLKALARGLRVREIELIRVAFGLADERDDQRSPDQSHHLVLIDLIKKTVISNDVAEIAQEVIKLSAGDRTVVLQYVKRLSKTDRKPQRKGRSA